MTTPRRSDIPDEVVAKRLADLADVDELMRSLRDARFVAGRVAEKSPDPDRTPSSGHEDPPAAQS